jgi:hypothetical protein
VLAAGAQFGSRSAGARGPSLETTRYHKTDHSGGSRVELLGVSHGDITEIAITDDGVGAFRRVQDQFSLGDELEAIAHLAKGGSRRRGRTGQGLFFFPAVGVF